MQSDLVFITPIYSAGEKEIKGVNNRSLAYQIKRLKPKLEIYAPDNNQELIKLLQEKTQPKDLILMMGAGNINMIWKKLYLESINNQSINSDLVA